MLTMCIHVGGRAWRNEDSRIFCQHQQTTRIVGCRDILRLARTSGSATLSQEPTFFTAKQLVDEMNQTS